ncbi:ubiquitin carboxyl-terminal hydrolase 2 isoform X2 [Selaginella moellendorffii]|uniref:ubiquitin carboxyl-terminal hydrolase 2 isoform X2 n=1 Tax=Selaginella moellendorffii TaxID=88036 RepID=UPI000D1CEA07|nr:ubiquitin carboxyl-terminal hydrolase 2 isoform X2 [Selaginella moellendorffii]|eukprot:XP_024518206.1 ubiquitin carboxyl-terminal hydrolase 2 isoform X2 [Selaginella moellendorffii]
MSGGRLAARQQREAKAHCAWNGECSMKGSDTAVLPVQFKSLAPKRASSLFRNFEKELVDTSAPNSSRRNSSTSSASRFAETSRPSASDLHELRYGRSSSISTQSSTTPKDEPVFPSRTSVRAIETKDEADGWNDFSFSSMPLRQPGKKPGSRGGEDEYEEGGRSSSRLSNSGGCSSSGTGLSQSFTEMNLRTRQSSFQDSRGSRSNSLNSRSSIQGRQVAGLVGLMNEGNTCFLNSCLQCLAHTVPLSSAILGPFSELIQTKGAAARSRRDTASLSEMLAYSFRQLLKDLCGKPSYSTASASMLLQSLQGLSPQFAGNRQHDAQEAMRTIIDGLHEALNRKPPGRPKCPEPPPTTPEAEIADICWEHHKMWNNSVIQDIFCGQLQSTIECSVCHRKSHCFDPFLDLSLPLSKSGGSDNFRNFGSSRSRMTIEDCLSAFVAPETLDPSNKYYCSGCKMHRQRSTSLHPRFLNCRLHKSLPRNSAFTGLLRS